MIMFCSTLELFYCLMQYLVILYLIFLLSIVDKISLNELKVILFQYQTLQLLGDRK